MSFSAEENKNFEEKLFRDENEQDSMSLSTFNAALGALLLYGFAINIAECFIFARLPAEFLRTSFSTLAIVVFIVGMIGLFAFGRKSAGPVSLFAAYNCCIIPIGFSVFAVTNGVEGRALMEAAMLTSAITLTMCLGGTLFPTFFLGIGRFLFFSLLTFVVAEFIGIFAFGYLPRWVDLIAVGLFSLYIAFDWAVAMTGSWTPRAVLRTAIDLYLDIINIFLSLVRGRK